MKKILFAGEGGQGVQVIAEILAKAAFLEGKESLYIPNFGVEQRGGASLAFVIISKTDIPYPKFEKADILAILSDRSIDRASEFISRNTRIVLGPGVKRIDTFKTDRVISLRKAGFNPKVWNILVLGEVNRLGVLVKKNSLTEAMEKRFSLQFSKNPGLRELDLQALEYQSHEKAI